MKVGLALDRFDPRRGGVEQWCWQFGTALVALGHEVHALAAECSPEVSAAGMLPCPVPPHKNRLAFAANIQAQAARLGLDILHDTGITWDSDILQPHGGSRLASQRQNLQLMPAWLRPAKQGIAKLLPRYRQFQALANKQFASGRTRFVAISKMVERDLVELHGVPPERIDLVYNGVDTDRFSPAHKARYREETRAAIHAKEALVLLLVAHNFALKGVPALLKATAMLASQGHAIKVVVAGGGNIAAARRLANQLSLGDRAVFVGAVQDARPWYAAADLYVQPTWYDPCSLVVLEALASGLPVITTRYNGAGELLRPDCGSILEDPRDHAALAEEIARWLPVCRLPATMAAARTQAMEHRFERNVQELQSVYAKLPRPCRRSRVDPAAADAAQRSSAGNSKSADAAKNRAASSSERNSASA